MILAKIILAKVFSQRVSSGKELLGKVIADAPIPPNLSCGKHPWVQPALHRRGSVIA